MILHLQFLLFYLIRESYAFIADEMYASITLESAECRAFTLSHAELPKDLMRVFAEKKSKQRSEKTMVKEQNILGLVTSQFLLVSKDHSIRRSGERKEKKR